MHAPDQDKPRVLVADDECIIADTLKTILDRNGFEVKAVYSGEESVAVAEVWPPDIFLTDVVMPGLNGIDAAIRISGMLPACQVLLFSGQAATNDLLIDARLRGYSFEILLKPVPPAELLARLRAVLPVRVFAEVHPARKYAKSL